MRRAIYAGSFDPVTLGHLDIIKRSSEIFDEIIVGVLNNSSKSPLFSVEERVNMLKEATALIKNCSVQAFLTTNIQYSYLSSSMVKEYASYGTDVSNFVPANVVPLLEAKYNTEK